MFRPLRIRRKGQNMKKWQKERNYQKTTNENSDVSAYIITVEGQDVEVSEEIFLMYSQNDRRERYLTREAEVGKKVSLDRMAEDEMCIEYLTRDAVASAEDILIETETEQEKRLQLAMLKTAMERLKEEDQVLIRALFFEGLSTRQYAAIFGVTQRAVMKRKQRILQEMKKFFENFEN